MMILKQVTVEKINDVEHYYVELIFELKNKYLVMKREYIETQHYTSTEFSFHSEDYDVKLASKMNVSKITEGEKPNYHEVKFTLYDGILSTIVVFHVFRKTVNSEKRTRDIYMLNENNILQQVNLNTEQLKIELKPNNTK